MSYTPFASLAIRRFINNRRYIIRHVILERYIWMQVIGDMLLILFYMKIIITYLSLQYFPIILQHFQGCLSLFSISDITKQVALRPV